MGDQVELVVIFDHTMWYIDHEELELREVLEYVREEMPEVEEATLEDYQAKNGQMHSIGDLFDLRVKYMLVSEEELGEIDQYDSYWDEFYRRYPNSQGIMVFSRVGFNSSITQALVYMGNQSGPLSGAGFYLLLARDNGVWMIQKEILVWVS